MFSYLSSLFLRDTLSPAASPTIEHNTNDTELYRSFYTAVMVLVRGSEFPRRRSLPEELVIYICRLAEFSLVYTQESPPGDAEVYAHGANVVEFSWFRTQPFTQYGLNRIESIQLTTLSRHQGWVSDGNAGSWSWFELRIAKPDSSNPEILRNREISTWESHTHPVKSPGFEEHRGDLFDRRHPMWDTIQEGDMLEVVMKAQFGGWRNVARRARLEIVTQWKPSAEMLNLMYTGARVN